LTSTNGRGVEGADIKKGLKLQPWVANSVFGASRQVLNFGCEHGQLYGENCSIHDSLKTFLEWMLSASAISILERLASKHGRFYKRLLTTLDIRVQEYISWCANSSDVDEIESSLLNFGSLKRNLRLQNISDLVGPVFPKPQGTRKALGGKGATTAEGPHHLRAESSPTGTLTPALPSHHSPSAGEGGTVHPPRSESGIYRILRPFPLPPDLQL
jgi:hypothetical protein